MIPPLEEVRAAHVFLVRRFALARRLDESAIIDALHEAAELARGRVEDEPAAILFALTRHPKRLGDAWLRLPLILAENVARKANMELRLDVHDVALETLRLRVAAKLATFEDVRAWMVTRTRSL